MALLVSKRVRQNFSSQLFGYGSASHQATIIAFVKTDVMMPGTYASFLGRNFSHHDYLNTVLNWSQNDGAGGANRQYYLGFVAIPPSTSSRCFYSDENGAYFNGPLTMTVVSEGQIGSVLVYHGGVVRGPNSMDATSAITVPLTSNTNFSTNYIAIPEGLTSANYAQTSNGRATSAFDGVNYVYNASTNQTYGEVFHYDHISMISDSVGVNNGSVFDVSSMTVSASNPPKLNSIKLKISEVM